jgi:hypothetical protein
MSIGQVAVAIHLTLPNSLWSAFHPMPYMARPLALVLALNSNSRRRTTSLQQSTAGLDRSHLMELDNKR